ncbi:PREDICTED: myosuppressin [Dinoponera quadriceps]|uniref:Myosuppressin n=1 Tax=Dinoponera quadriceps TaxID=609295 RepID=A0A6P3WTX2_DINQU|nr:PREDICTED: myosuppressin [Dinoponera quadriceps]
MMSSTLMVLVSVTTMALISGEAFAVLPAKCNAGFLEELPPRLRKFCITIAKVWNANGMNNPVDDTEYREFLPLYNSDVKRQDVDHIFLRFGRRR